MSRGTVVDAYDALPEHGLIVATAGRDTRVAPLSPVVPALRNLARTAGAAHDPDRTFHFEDQDGTPLYLNGAD